MVQQLCLISEGDVFVGFHYMIWAIRDLVRGISIETKGKWSLMVGVDYTTDFWVQMTAKWADFKILSSKYVLQFECLWGCHQVCSSEPSEWPTQQQAWRLFIYELLWVIFLFISGCLVSVVLGKGQFYFLMISSHKFGRKVGNASLDSWSQVLEETINRRIQDPVSSQIENKNSKVI